MTTAGRAEHKTTLDGLKPGQSGIILGVGNTNGAVKRRLVDMGLTPGTEVTVRKIAPFGDPIEVRLRGYELSLRRADADQIRMTTDRSGGARARPVRRSDGRSPMLQRVPNEEMLRRMQAGHAHEAESHDRTPAYATHDTREMKIALVGNPNSGKTTLFNALTGSNQYVGNWPGVTVEKKEGHVTVDGHPVSLVDLPGIYSLSPYSMEEIVARDFIVKEAPDAIINIVDATNIERNLYLTVQLLEMERPTVLALNFMDEAARRGDRLDCAALSKRLGVPVVPITARDGTNVTELLRVAHRQMHTGVTLEPDDLYDDYTHVIHHKMGELIHDRAYAAELPAHWACIKLIEGDALVEKALALDARTKASVEALAAEYEDSSDLGDRETLVADSRYRFIEQLIGEAVTKGGAPGARTPTDRIDGVVTHKYLAVPIFFLMMLLIFSVTFGPVGGFFSDAVERLTGGWLAGGTEALLRAAGVMPWAVSLVVDGVIGGVGAVLTFFPQIALLFFFLSLLEDSGYMARAAFVMDRLLHRFGLSGKAFIPMLMGFGCTVPAVMGARTMENEKDRRMTILLVPFMSCSARLPVYGLMASAFLPRWQGLAIFSLYAAGILMAIVSGMVFRHTVFQGDAAPFVMELPPYRLPTARNTLLHVWDRLRGFLVRAGTLILIMSVALWFLQSFDLSLHMVESNGDSILSHIGGFIAPALSPLGFGSWMAAVALLTGLIAKEAVVATLSLLYGFSASLDGGAAAQALSATFTPLSAYSFLVFTALYVPCAAALATIRKELSSTKWMLAGALWQLSAAYLAALLVYQTGRLLGF